MHIGDWSARGAAYWPERVALRDAASGRTFTYAEVARRSESVGRRLHKLVTGLLHDP